MDSVNPRDFGHLEGRVDALQHTVAAQSESMKLMAEQLKTMNDTLTEAKGGWRAMMYVAGTASALGGMLTWIIQHMTFKGPQ